ncbi:MAG: hypothetical protein ACLU9S_22750 [Oscillospiraceae bacterium]
MDSTIDENLDITHDHDTQGDHGTHVSGIATANRYVAKNGASGVTYSYADNGVVRYGARCPASDYEGLWRRRRRFMPMTTSRPLRMPFFLVRCHQPVPGLCGEWALHLTGSRYMDSVLAPAFQRPDTVVCMSCGTTPGIGRST